MVLTAVIIKRMSHNMQGTVQYQRDFELLSRENRVTYSLTVWLCVYDGTEL
jgi:hypothetical protein